MDSFTGNSKDPIIVKAVVDKAYLTKLLEAEKDLQKIRDSEKAEKEKKQDQLSEQFGAGVVDTTEIDQIGEGPPKAASKQSKHSKQNEPPLSEEKLRKIFREEIHRYFSKPPTNFVEHLKNIKVKDVLQHIPYVNQLIGRGAVDDDLTPNPIDTFDNVHSNNEGAYYSQLGNAKPIITNPHDFLKLIPHKFHERAQRLLDYFNNHSMNVRWNDEGNVIVADEFIPNSNIYAIFTQLYKIRPDYDVPGFATLASYLLNAGLGHLFLKHKYWFNVNFAALSAAKQQAAI